MAAPDPANRQPFLGDRVVVDLRRLIFSGVLSPGERIVERDVAERLGTSRGPVRDAIRTLGHEGLVEIRPYAGACVTQLDREEVDEIAALRRQVEYFSFAGAALRAADEEIEELRALATRMGAVAEAGDPGELLDLDLRFHLGVCAASHHPTLTVTMRTLHPRLAILFHPQMLQTETPEMWQRAHLELVDALASRDVDASVAAIDAHLDRFSTDLELRIDGGRPRERPEYLTRQRPARPVAVRRRLGTLD